MTTAPLLPALIAAAREAGAAAMRHYEAGTAVETKADGSPVTAADRAAEAVILAALAELAPSIPAISEEEAAAGRIPDRDQRFWLVDPLDGTKEFVRRSGEFTVNIGLIDHGAPVLGIVYAPVIDDLYAAAEGRAWRSLGGEPLRPIAARTPPAAGLTVLTSRSHGKGAAVEDYLAALPVAERVSRGSSLKICLIAAGEADLYPRFGPTCEWDTAAADAVLRAAGGMIERLDDGAPLPYGKPDYLNPNFVARGRR
ncbi:MAG TPA: 3'(2'),5'-bisphosphate nucleotidase CysQ [Alphaproteobacteria bacterium]|nr:3'(2'),5'-bisphosphate nucleotidase CysQ [Alphaproteobacteria bacterium]